MKATAQMRRIVLFTSQSAKVHSSESDTAAVINLGNEFW